MTKYVTRTGDELDWVCWRHYGRASGVVEAVLEANPGLSGYGERLPAGLTVNLPDFPEPDRRRSIRLWD